MGVSSILVVEDDDSVALTIERCLRRDNHNVTLAGSGVQALQIARRHIPDLVLLDVLMPGMDGFAVCREMRADPMLAKVPIIFLTARIKDEDRIKGFLAGADDYISKPFNLQELTLRIRAVLRRVQANLEVNDQSSKSSPFSKNIELDKTSLTELKVKGYTLNLRNFELITPSGGHILLTPIQFDLLFQFMSHPGEIYSPSRLLDEIWDYPSDAGSPDLVRVHIKNLRMRVEEDPSAPTFIETIPGYGYTIRES